MTTYEIEVNGKHAATVSVRHEIELCSIVATIRKMWDTPIVEIEDGERFEWYPDPDEGGAVITSKIIRMR